MIGDICEGGIYHAIDWKSHLSARPKKSSASTETLAAGEGVENGIILKGAIDIIIGCGVHLVLCVVWKDLYNSL